MRRAATVAVLALALALLGVSGARADVFEASSLVDSNQFEQANVAEHPAISGDGRYVAFDGSFGGVSGVWRKDLATGALAPVAVGPAGTPEGESDLPSISANGRYVSFTTTARLDEKNDTNSGPDVYVRDMENPSAKACPAERTEPCAFELASAADESERGLEYSYGSPAEETQVGALASGRSALSADGRFVAFVTTASSNLAGTQTPALQVAVRDLEMRRTYLVSAAYDPGTGKPQLGPGGRDVPVPTVPEGGTVGAVYDIFGSIQVFRSKDPAVGASISADGTTVAWLGQQLAAQVPLLPEDPERRADRAEPLWRRWESAPARAGVPAAVQPLEPTRRVSGGSDPINPACLASGETELRNPPTLEDPCQGPFAPGEGTTGIEPAVGTDYLPRLSTNGEVVAFLASAPLVGGGEFGGTGSFSDDLYVVDMADGLTRVQALRRLTAIAAGSAQNFGRVEPIEDLGVSPDGTEIAFSSRRTVFPLGSPSYVSPPLSPPVNGSGPQQIYDVDLGDDTLARVTQGFNGEPTELPPHAAVTGLMGSPSFSGDGDTLAFSSVAPNLEYGDGNNASDVFVVKRKLFGATAVQQYITPAPSNPSAEPDWVFGVSAISRRDGSVLLEVYVPGAGELSAQAQAAVIVGTSGARSSRKGKRAARGRSHHAVATRRVASAARASGGEGMLVLRLALASAYRAQASQKGGLSATVGVAFSAPGHGVLRTTLPVTFSDPPPPHAHHKHKKKHAAKGHAR